MPAGFAHDFRRYTGLIQAGNPFMIDDSTP
jgi:hypothetical protein